MSRQIYNSPYGNVEYIEEDNVVLLTWIKKCSYDDYRDTTLSALNALREFSKYFTVTKVTSYMQAIEIMHGKTAQ